MLYILLIFVLQICYCSADCVCPGAVVLQHYQIIIIGLTIASLFITTVALAVVVYKLRRGHDNERSIFGKAKLSISKYQRQESGNRMILRDSLNDDTDQLNSNEEDINNEDSDGIIANEVRVETEPNRPPKIKQKPKIPIFPQMPEEQINKICEAVLSRHRKKEFTSLSELDKIVNETKAEKPKTFDTSASTPELDALDDSSPIPKLPVFDANSKESKLRDEMKAMFNQDEFKSKLNKGKNKPETNMHTIDSKEIKLNQNDNGIKLKDINNTEEILSKVESNLKNEINCDDKSQVDEENEAFIGNQGKTEEKLSQAEINSKRINLAIMAKFNHGGLKSKVKVGQEDSVSCDDTKTENEDVVQDDIYDCPPTPRPQNEVYDFLPSPKKTVANDFPSSSNKSDELYDFPPSPKPKSDELYDFPPHPKPKSDELYDFPPHPKPHKAGYDSVPSPLKNRIVSDGNATDYIFPLSGSNLDIFDDPQYSNARSVSDKDFL